MTSDAAFSDYRAPRAFALQNLPLVALAPLPLPLLRRVFAHIVTDIARRQPGLFARLGGSAGKRVLIDPVNLPFVLLLQPDPAAPRLRPFRRRALPPHDARITGTFLTLLDLIDGQTDGDALFFSRDLSVEGDTEAVVALRNALDDMDSTLADEVAVSFGPAARPARAVLSGLRKVRRTRR